MMEALTAYDRPFPPAGTGNADRPAQSRGRSGRCWVWGAADAFDAALVTGGLPLICAEWAARWRPVEQYLGLALANPVSRAAGVRGTLPGRGIPRPHSGPDRTEARSVPGRRSFTNILERRRGDRRYPLLNRALGTLMDKRIVAGELPVSLQPSKDRRYRVTDPYLRFWLRFSSPARTSTRSRRGRGRYHHTAHCDKAGPVGRGRAVEPLGPRVTRPTATGPRPTPTPR